MQPLIELRGVEKRFATGTLALHGVDLAVRSHEFVSILGPSGCGKSTVLRMIAGLDTPSAGDIVRAPVAAPSDPAAPGPRVPVGFVFQEPTLMPWCNVFDNVWLPLRVAGQTRARARETVNLAIELVGLSAFASAFPRELSGGMKMRVSIARALVAQPRLLLMDEPFAALDEITRARLNDDLLAWWQPGELTVIFVTHSVFEAVYLSERILVMTGRPGQVSAEIRVDEPYPRGEAFRTSARYLEACQAASRALRLADGTAQ